MGNRFTLSDVFNAVKPGSDLQSLLYGLQPYHPAMMLLSALLLAGVSLLAAAIPARRAAQIDPMTALRDE